MEMRSSGRLTHDVLRLACACDLMTAGAKLPWQVASAVCVNNGKLRALYVWSNGRLLSQLALAVCAGS